MPTIPVALCITDLDVGGAEKILVELACRLDRERFTPEVFCLAPRPAPSHDALPRRLDSLGIPTHFLNAGNILGFSSVVGRLARLLARQHPRLVQSFLFHANVASRLAARRAGIPRILSGVRVAQRRGRWHLWLDWLTSRHVDRYVCVSQAVAHFTQVSAGIPAERIVVIPNGIDPTPYPAAPADLTPFGIPAGSRTILHVGRLHRQKGLDWFLPAVQGLIRDNPDLQVLLVGSGPEERRLRQLTEQLGLTQRVHFALWQADVAGILAASTLLALPSRWEGMPNVLLEAMATGLPVVATDVEGVRELLGPLAAGQTVAFGDTAALVSQVNILLRDPQRRMALGTANRRRVETDASIDRMIRSYEELWASLL